MVAPKCDQVPHSRQYPPPCSITDLASQVLSRFPPHKGEGGAGGWGAIQIPPAPQSTPSPLWGGIKGGGGWPEYQGSRHPHPASPIKGEVPIVAAARSRVKIHFTGATVDTLPTRVAPWRAQCKLWWEGIDGWGYSRATDSRQYPPPCSITDLASQVLSRFPAIRAQGHKGEGDD